MKVSKAYTERCGVRGGAELGDVPQLCHKERCCQEGLEVVEPGEDASRDVLPVGIPGRAQFRCWWDHPALGQWAPDPLGALPASKQCLQSSLHAACRVTSSSQFNVAPASSCIDCIVLQVCMHLLHSFCLAGLPRLIEFSSSSIHLIKRLSENHPHGVGIFF